MPTNAAHFAGGIVLDFDDTIAATRESRSKILRKVASSQFGIQISEEGINSNWGKPFDELLRCLAPTINEKEFSNVYADVMRRHPPKILPGVRHIFQEAYLNNIAILVLSSGSNQLVYQDIEAANLSDFVLKLWGYEDTSRHKPDPKVLEPILAFSSSLGISKNTLLSIGDSTSDHHVAQRNGIPFIATLTGGHTQNDFLLAGLPKDRIVKNLSSIRLEGHTVFVKGKKMFSL